MTDSIPLYLISGFLGAGKTTLLKNLLQQRQESKVGIIVNEFGDVGIDGKLLAQDDVRLVELSNGSIFCACLKENFSRTLVAFSSQPIDALIIEGSGMADPSSMNTIIRGLKPYCKRPYEYQGSICVIDCTSYLDYADIFIAAQHQVLAADLLLLNKSDLATPEEIEEVRAALTAINPLAGQYVTVQAALPPGYLSQHLHNSGFEQESSNQIQNRPASNVLQLPPTITLEQIQALCAYLQPHIWRLKGFARVGESWWNVSVTGGQASLEPTSIKQLHPQYSSRLVVIWREQDHEEQLRQAEKIIGSD